MTALSEYLNLILQDIGQKVGAMLSAYDHIAESYWVTAQQTKFLEREGESNKHCMKQNKINR